ncbi:hypothetical protein [Aestuariivirga sp.]|uniref:hypothetical protein n=1 Tax=Aestuariivirga sp. TaxID=2650926 RepID=UPI0039E6D99A
MSKLMMIAGVLLTAAAVALGLMIFFSKTSGEMAGFGITPEVAMTALVGGILSFGLGGVIAAIEGGVPARPARTAEPRPATASIPEFGRRAAETAAVATAAAATAPDVSPEVTETIRALEQAKSNIRQAFGDEPAAAETVAVAEAVEEVDPAEHAEANEPLVAAEEAAPEDEEEAEESSGEQLYVVEERTIHNRPARILSDGTVEAETDEGWMRFENLEHLNEYVEAMSPS